MAMLSKMGNENLTLLPAADSSPSTTAGNVENWNHKNDLNCYCQKLGIPLPVYDTRVEGSAHALRFKSSVTVAHNTFTPSSNAFATRKSAAEQDAAKLALQHLITQELAKSTNLRLHLRKLVCQDKARCKMILNEFLAKVKMECSYQTLQVSVVPSVFVSSVALNGTCYKGELGKNKKEAEQLAALEAILSLLDDPTYAASISNVIKSKFNANAAFNEAKENLNTGDCSLSANMCKSTTLNSVVPLLTQKASLIDESNFRVLVDQETPTSVDLGATNTEEQGVSENLEDRNSQDLVNSLPPTKNQSGHGVLDSKQGGTGLPTEAMDNSSCSNVNLPITSPSLSKAQHGMKLPDAAQSASQQISVPIEKQGDAGPPSDAVTNSYISLPITSQLFSKPQHEVILPEAAQLVSQENSVPVEKQGAYCALDDRKGGADFPTEAVTISYVNRPTTSPSVPKPQHGIILPEAAQPISQINSALVTQAALSPVYDLISSKKRERNKKKANKRKENKRLRAENKMLSL